MVELFANGARGPLAVDLAPGDPTLQLGAGSEVLFPTPGAGDFFWLTLENGPAEDPTEREIVLCSVRAGNVLTIARAQQGTIAQAFPSSSSRVELRLTAATLASMQSALGLGRRYIAGGVIPVTTAFDNYGSLAGIVISAGSVSVTPTATTRGTASNRRSFSTVNIHSIAGASANQSSVLGLRGRSPRAGGFELISRFLIHLDAGAAAKFFGISNSTSTNFLPVATNPTGLTTVAMVGIGQEISTPIGTLGGTWQLYHHDGGGGAVTQIDTGIQKVIDNLLQLRIWSLPGRASFFLELIDFDAGVRFFAELTTNIPGSNSPMQVTICSRSNAVLSDGWSQSAIWHYQW